MSYASAKCIPQIMRIDVGQTEEISAESRLKWSAQGGDGFQPDLTRGKGREWGLWGHAERGSTSWGVRRAV